MEEMRESYGDNVAFLYISDDMKWGRANIKDKENDLYFVGAGISNDSTLEEQQEDAATDFALLCSCNHTIITNGLFSHWGAKWTGGEYYTEYGSIVPSEVNEAIEVETVKSAKDQSFIYGANTGDPEGQFKKLSS